MLAAAEVKLKGGENNVEQEKTSQRRKVLIAKGLRRRAMHDEDLTRMKSSDFDNGQHWVHSTKCLRR